jgi:hypothetical protein
MFTFDALSIIEYKVCTKLEANLSMVEKLEKVVPTRKSSRVTVSNELIHYIELILTSST